MANRADTATTAFVRFRRPALIVGIAAAVLGVVGAIVDIQAFMHAYLMAYIFWLGIALGCLAVIMIQNLAGGFWGAVIRRLLEAGTRLLLPLAVLFLPILVAMPLLYAWDRPGGFPEVDRAGLQAGLSERALLHRPRGDLLCGLDHPGATAQPVVVGAGPDG